MGICPMIGIASGGEQKRGREDEHDPADGVLICVYTGEITFWQLRVFRQAGIRRN